MINTHPPLMCAARSSDAAYYTIVLPIDIIAAAGTSLLLSVVVAMIKVICALCSSYHDDMHALLLSARSCQRTSLKI